MEEAARNLTGVDAGPIQIGLAQIHPAQVALPEVAVAKVEAVCFQPSEIQPPEIAPSEVALVAGGLFRIEFLDAAFAEQPVHRIIGNTERGSCGGRLVHGDSY